MSRETVRELFPLGFLPIVGVVTTGGWVCTGVTPKHATFTRCAYWRGLHHNGGATVVRLADGSTCQGAKTNPVDVGELLPIFDPAEQPGTWAVLLREFVREVCGGHDTVDEHGQPEPANLFWRAAMAYEKRPACWVLIASGVRQWKNQLALSFDAVPGETPAEALQRCWLLVRRNTYRVGDRGWDDIQLDGTSRCP